MEEKAIDKENYEHDKRINEGDGELLPEDVVELVNKEADKDEKENRT